MVKPAASAAIQSMTGTAQRSGSAGGTAWAWDVRSVNARGLDLRLRLPDGVPGLETAVRSAARARLARGTITVGLRIVAEGGPAGAPDPAALDAALTAMSRVRTAAEARGLPLSPGTLAEVLALPGVWVAGGQGVDMAALGAALLADVDPLIEDLCTARRAEGSALAALISAHLDRIETLTTAADAAAQTRAPGSVMDAALARLADGEARAVDPDRLAQELALIAARGDVTEELDRLRAHAMAARAALRGGGPVGRKLDFLMQEFMREANTLCSKSQDSGLTAVGLDLKLAIDQMREQAANVE